jgi:hypothetical protein
MAVSGQLYVQALDTALGNGRAGVNVLAVTEWYVRTGCRTPFSGHSFLAWSVLLSAYILPISALQWLTIPHRSSNVRTQLSHRWGWRGPARKWRHRAPLQCSIKQIDDRVHRQITRRIVLRAECARSTCKAVTTVKLALLSRLSLGRCDIPERIVCFLILKRSGIAARVFCVCKNNLRLFSNTALTGCQICSLVPVRYGLNL